jgi:LytS/YehU family sensor histidine kinase
MTRIFAIVILLFVIVNQSLSQNKSEDSSKSILIKSNMPQNNNSISFVAFVFTLVFIFVISSILIINVSLRRNNEKLKSEKIQNKLQQQTVMLEMHILRAQMNPHFIFNCLNAINHFILKNEMETASNYLISFSRLVRLVLNNSRQSLITIEEELSMMRLYLDLEKVRFNNAFDYNIHIEKDLDITSLNIPPLIIQPFVENAIWHGLMHKDDPGLLSISIRTNNNILICEITDNGIGRKRAYEFKSKSVEIKKSMGIEITKKRLELLNGSFEPSSFIEIHDLQDKSGIASGTKVVLTFNIDSIKRWQKLMENLLN